MVEFTIKELHDMGFLHGLAWFNEDLYRFPLNVKDKLDPNLWEKVTMPSGVRLKFRTQSDVLIIDAAYLVDNMQEQVSKAANGFDIYADGELLQTIAGPIQKGPFFGFADLDGTKSMDYEVFLPYHTPIEFKVLVLEYKNRDEEPVLEPSKSIYEKEGSLVFYGSSITHGSHAQRSGITYPAIISRRLNLDFINLGFGGAGKGEPEVADLLADIPEPLMYILDWGINIWSDEEKDFIYPRYGALIQKLKQSHPDTPILLVNLQTGGPQGSEGDHMRENIEEIRDEIKRVYDKEIQDGNKLIFYTDAMDIINQENISEYTTDRIHPNQAGFILYANHLTPIIKEILEL